MPDQYPYVMSNNRIKPILEKARSAAKPKKFTHEFLKQLGFSSSNDRAIVPLLRRLGFLADDGTPTSYYDLLRDENKRGKVLAERIKDLYGDLFAIDTNVHKAKEDEVKGAISRVTGKDESSVQRYYNTFKTLVSIADFEAAGNTEELEKATKQSLESPRAEERGTELAQFKGSFHYNIQIHLPATTDISVYNAIFKSLREILG